MKPLDFPVTSIVNTMTIDVEDYFQVGAFADRIARDAWTPIRAASSATSTSSSRSSTPRRPRPRSSRSAGSPSGIRR